MGTSNRSNHDALNANVAAEQKIVEIEEERASTKAVVRSNGLPDDGRQYIPRSDLARVTGISVRQLASAYEGNMLTPVKNAKGQVFYAVDESNAFLSMTGHWEHTVERTVKRTRETTSTVAPWTPDQAVEAFTRLKAGKTAVDLVIEMKLDPRVARMLDEEHTRGLQKMVLDGHHLTSLRHAFAEQMPFTKIRIEQPIDIVNLVRRLCGELVSPIQAKLQSQCTSCTIKGKSPGEAVACWDCVREARKAGHAEGMAFERRRRPPRMPKVAFGEDD